jgi:membrane fusion protein (multidrug efflux system)
MYLTAAVVVDRRSSILTLPLETILAEGETKYVYVIKNGPARRVAVTTGMRGGSNYEIVEGLFAGDTVVTAGAGNLTDGAKVKIIQ